MMAILAHIDLDAFFASCEAIRNPALADRSIVICMYSGRGDDGGAVSTADYTARDIGIHAGMPITKAKQLATESDMDCAFLGADKEHYKQVSERVFSLVADHAAEVEQASVDEAYADLSHCDTYEEAEQVAAAIKQAVTEQEDLTASVGIGPNKFVAKMASDRDKPDGCTVIRPDEAASFIGNMDVVELHGVGPKTVEQLSSMDVETADDLQDVAVQRLVREFGEARGVALHEKAYGNGSTDLEETEQKQLSRLTTLPENTRQMQDLRPVIRELAQDVICRVDDREVKYECVTALIVTDDLNMRSRRETLNGPTAAVEPLFRTAERLTKAFLADHDSVQVRRVGVRVSAFTDADQTTLDAF